MPDPTPDDIPTDLIERILQPITAADAAALRRGERIDTTLYERNIDLAEMRRADQVPIPVEVDVYELMRAGMHLYYSIYYLNPQQAHALFSAMPDQVAEAYLRATRAFAPHIDLPDEEQQQ